VYDVEIFKPKYILPLPLPYLMNTFIKLWCFCSIIQ